MAPGSQALAHAAGRGSHFTSHSRNSCLRWYQSEVFPSNPSGNATARIAGCSLEAVGRGSAKLSLGNLAHTFFNPNGEI